MVWWCGGVVVWCGGLVWCGVLVSDILNQVEANRKGATTLLVDIFQLKAKEKCTQIPYHLLPLVCLPSS